MNRLRVIIPLVVLGWLGVIASWIANGPEENPAATADVAIVLGAAVEDFEPSPVFRERILHGITLHSESRVANLIFTGGKSEEDRVAESEVGRAIAVGSGIAEASIFYETRSRTTFQNLAEARDLMREEGLETAIIVSDPLHLRRAMVMADAFGIDAVPSATPSTRYRSWSTKAPFLLREVYFMHHFWLFGE